MGNPLKKGTIMFIKHPAWRRAGIAVAALFMAVSIAAAAPARIDPGDSPKTATLETNQHCKMSRIGHQMVRCDSLTGAGVDAPSWILED